MLKFTKGIKIGIGCAAAVAVVGGTVTAAAMNGAFLSKPNKIMTAGVNTFQEAMLVEDLMEFAKIATTKEYTLEVGAEYNDLEAQISCMVDGKKKGISAEVKGSLYATSLDLEADLVLDKKDVSFYAPALGDVVYQYDYTKIPKGELFAEVSESDIQLVNELLEYLYNLEASSTIDSKDLYRAVMDEVKEMSIEKVDKKEFSINDKDKNCTGYEVRVKGKNLANILDNLYDLFEEQYKKELEKLADIEGAELDVEEILSQMDEELADVKEDLREMEPVDVTFYLNGLTYAAIEAEVQDVKMQVLFEGGKRPTQNMRFKVEGETIAQIKGSTEDGIDSSRIIVEDETVLKIRHDKKSGVTRFTVGDGDLAASFKISIKNERSSSKVKLYDIEGMGADGIEVYIGLEKGAKFPSMRGEKFDIGSASEEDFEELVEKIEPVINQYFGGLSQ